MDRKEELRRELLIKIVGNWPRGVTTTWIGLCAGVNLFDPNYVEYSEMKKMLGCLLIEKKIDYTKEGLWAPVK